MVLTWVSLTWVSGLLGNFGVITAERGGGGEECLCRADVRWGCSCEVWARDLIGSGKSRRLVTPASDGRGAEAPGGPRVIRACNSRVSMLNVVAHSRQGGRSIYTPWEMRRCEDARNDAEEHACGGAYPEASGYITPQTMLQRGSDSAPSQTVSLGMPSGSQSYSRSCSMEGCGYHAVRSVSCQVMGFR